MEYLAGYRRIYVARSTLKMDDVQHHTHIGLICIWYLLTSLFFHHVQKGMIVHYLLILPIKGVSFFDDCPLIH